MTSKSTYQDVLPCSAVAQNPCLKTTDVVQLFLSLPLALPYIGFLLTRLDVMTFHEMGVCLFVLECWEACVLLVFPEV